MPTPLRLSLAPYEAYPLFEVLQRTASRLPDKTAVIDGDRAFTFAQLDEQSDRFAAALSSLGVEKGDRVGLFAPNCAEFITAYFGILKTGATVVPVNAAYRSRELTHQLHNSGVKVLVSHQATLPVVETARPDLPGLKTVINVGPNAPDTLNFDQLVSESSPHPPSITIDPKVDLAALPSSSGTTGLPKGVMLTHFNLTSNLEQTLKRPGEASAPYRRRRPFGPPTPLPQLWHDRSDEHCHCRRGHPGSHGPLRHGPVP